MELIDHVDKHLDENPALQAEKFIADASVTAFARLDTPVNPDKMNINPKRFVKPMTLHEIKKKLQENPNLYGK